jgi:hypothetical protein
MSALQCPKRLHLEVHHPDLKNFSPATEAIFATGHRVGALAREVLGDNEGVYIDRNWGVRATLERTAALIEQGTPAIYEAALQHENVLVYVDILRRDGDAWRLVEVKSSGRVKDEHRLDCAIQTWVARGADLPIAGVNLAHIDSSFVYPGEERYAGLFAEPDITAEVEGLLPLVPTWVEDAVRAAGDSEPAVDVGTHCNSPNECPFRAQCWPTDTKYPVTGLGGRKDKLAELVCNGYSDICEVPEDALHLDGHKRIHRITRAGEPELLEEAVTLTRELAYPRHYLDFETINSAIPVWAGTRPFEALPFQWSCHIERSPGSFSHAEFLDVSGEPPMRAFAETLLDTLGDPGPILTYSHYEKRIISELATRFPDLASALRPLIDQLVDLLPIAKRNYYHPDMLGSWSIKKVLPTVAPDMRYSELDEVQDGQAAGAAYLEATDPATSDARREHLRARLLEYCRFDTEAMVRLTHFFASGGR